MEVSFIKPSHYFFTIENDTYCIYIMQVTIAGYILQLLSSDPSEQCVTPSHTCALRIQAPVLSHLKSLTETHGELSVTYTYIYMYINIILYST